MTGKLKTALIAVGVIAALGGGGAAIAAATSSDEGGKNDGNGKPVHGRSLRQASAVALNQTGGGRVTASELRDEEGYYEIEVTKTDGSLLDVHLDKGLHVLDAQADGTSSADQSPNGG